MSCILVTMIKTTCSHYSTEHGGQYISPATTRSMIRKIVQRTIRHSPRVLINTTTGRMHNRAERASAPESLPILNELVSSMTIHIDYLRIKCEVRQYFRYVMLLHKWEVLKTHLVWVSYLVAYISTTLLWSSSTVVYFSDYTIVFYRL